MTSTSPLVGVIMGSRSDYQVLEPAVEILRDLQVPFEKRIVSAHRTPDWMFEYASTAEKRGLQVIIAAAGGAAHLPGMVASKTIIPVLGVPIPATMLLPTALRLPGRSLLRAQSLPVTSTAWSSFTALSKS